MAIDYKFKSEVINSGFCQLEKKVSNALFKFNQYNNKGSDLLEMSYNTAIKVHNNMLRTNSREWAEAKKINCATRHRARRLKQRIEIMLVYYKCWFLTLTFSDEVLKNTSANTRRQYVVDFCNSLNPYDYVANKDFGKINNREHYHCVIAPGVSKIDYTSWSCGNLDGEVCNKNATALSKYVAKLTNHAIKETTKRESLIYCRKFKLEKMTVVR